MQINVIIRVHPMNYNIHLCFWLFTNSWGGGYSVYKRFTTFTSKLITLVFGAEYVVARMNQTNKLAAPKRKKRKGAKVLCEEINCSQVANLCGFITRVTPLTL